jgi:hypothetical protein
MQLLAADIEQVVEALVAASLLTWVVMLARAGVTRQLPLAWSARPACPWPGSVPALALPVAMITQVLVNQALSAWGNLGAGHMDLAALRNQSLARLATLGALLALVAAESGLRRADLGLMRGQAARDLFAGMLAFLASWGPVYYANRMVAALGWRAEGGIHPMLKLLEADSRAAALAWVAVSAVLLAPLLEELLYRVILQGWLESRAGPMLAIPLVALLFAAVHFEPGRPDGLPLFPLALVLGYLYWRRHSYLAVVLAHSAFNAMNVAIAALSL